MGMEPKRCPSLLSQAATYLWSRGQYRQALPLNEQALAGLRQLLGEDHPDTLWSVHSLAEALRNLGDLYEQALAGRRRVLGDDHPDTLQSMNNLAAVRQELGEL
jgi:tetratricopeptide (TPR) repeat protein